LPLFCGIDWATEHHDVAVVDVDGRVVARGRVSDDAVGFAQLAQAGDSAAHPIPAGIETDRGPWLAALRETGRVIYPITRASGKNTVVLHRHIKNRRLAAAGPIWALSALCASPGRRGAGDWNRQAQRHPFNEFFGQLHHCLSTGRRYNEHLAFPPPPALAA
jgi:hypothetical protein